MGAKTVDTNSTSQNASTFHPNKQAGDAYSSALYNAQGLGGIGPNATPASSLVAPVNQQQLGAISNINADSSIYSPYYKSANAATGAGASALDPGNFASTVGQYENPYIQNVIGTTMANINQQNQLQDQGAIGNAIQAGNAFGGDRMGLGLSALANQQDLASNQTIAGLESAGYNQATGVAEQGAANKLAAGAQYGNLGSGAEASALSGASAQLGAGTLEQQTSQALATAPEQQATWLTGIDTGLGGAMSYNSSTNGSGTQSVPAGNIGSTILGGAALLGGILKRGGPVDGKPHFDDGGPIEGPGSIPGLDSGSGGILSQAIISAGKHPGTMAPPYEPPGNLGALSQAATSGTTIPTSSQLQGYSTAGQNLGDLFGGDSSATVPMGTGSTQFRKGGSVRGYDDGGVIDTPDVSDSALAALLPPQPNYGSLGSGPVNDNTVPEPQAATGTLGAQPSFGNVPPNAMQQLTANAGGVLNPDINQGSQPPSTVGNIGSSPSFANQPPPTGYAGNAGPDTSAPDPSSYINQMPAPNVSRETFASLGDVPTPPVRPSDLGSPPAPAAPSGPTSLASAPAYPGSNGGSMYTGPVHLASMGSAPVDSGGAAQTPSLGSAPGNAHSLLGALFTNESGLRNIANTHQGTSSGQAQGFFQITTGTWNEFANKAGIDTSKYPTPMSAPYDVQASVAANIPLKRWDPTTLSAIRNAGFAIDPNKTLGENVAATGGDFSADALAYDGARRGGTGNVSSAPASQAINAASPPSGNLGSSPAAADTSAAPQHGLTGLLGDTGPLKSLGINLSPDARMALISAGLGMMASRSPFLGQAIGEGGLAGMKQYQTQQQLDLQRQNTGSEVGLRNAQTEGVGYENQMKKLGLDMARKSMNGPIAGLGSSGSPGTVAAGLQKSVAQNAKGLSSDPDSPSAAPSSSVPPVPNNQNPSFLRQQAEQLQDRAIGVAAINPGMSERMQAQAQQLLTQASEITKNGRYTATDDQGNVRTFNLPGFSEAEGNIAGAKASAEFAARAPFEMKEVQDTPGGPTRYVSNAQLAGIQKNNPKATVVGIGAGSPPGAAIDAAVAANPAIAKQPDFYAKRQDMIQGEEQKMIEAYPKRQMVEQRLQTMANIMQNYQSGAFATQKQEFVRMLNGVGIPVKASDTANPTAFEEMMKNAQANVFGQAQEIGGKLLVTELTGLGKANANPELQPAANAAILGQALGIAKWEDKHTEDYFAWKHQQNPDGTRPNENAVSTDQFEIPWVKANPLEASVGQATKGIAYKGQEIPAAAQRQAGQTYLTPKGPMVWQGNGWSAPTK